MPGRRRIWHRICQVGRRKCALPCQTNVHGNRSEHCKHEGDESQQAHTHVCVCVCVCVREMCSMVVERRRKTGTSYKTNSMRKKARRGVLVASANLRYVVGQCWGAGRRVYTGRSSSRPAPRFGPAKRPVVVQKTEPGGGRDWCRACRCGGDRGAVGKSARPGAAPWHANATGASVGRRPVWARRSVSSQQYAQPLPPACAKPIRCHIGWRGNTTIHQPVRIVHKRGKWLRVPPPAQVPRCPGLVRGRVVEAGGGGEARP